eukprot:scaffold7506_cov286-Pinguiococcus_pyrenoidosus.AAC.1
MAKQRRAFSRVMRTRTPRCRTLPAPLFFEDESLCLGETATRLCSGACLSSEEIALADARLASGLRLASNVRSSSPVSPKLSSTRFLLEPRRRFLDSPSADLSQRGTKAGRGSSGKKSGQKLWSFLGWMSASALRTSRNETSASLFSFASGDSC